MPSNNDSNEIGMDRLGLSLFGTHIEEHLQFMQDRSNSLNQLTDQNSRALEHTVRETISLREQSQFSRRENASTSLREQMSRAVREQERAVREDASRRLEEEEGRRRRGYFQRFLHSNVEQSSLSEPDTLRDQLVFRSSIGAPLDERPTSDDRDPSFPSDQWRWSNPNLAAVSQETSQARRYRVNGITGEVTVAPENEASSEDLVEIPQIVNQPRRFLTLDRDSQVTFDNPRYEDAPYEEIILVNSNVSGFSERGLMERATGRVSSTPGRAEGETAELSVNLTRQARRLNARGIRPGESISNYRAHLIGLELRRHERPYSHDDPEVEFIDVIKSGVEETSFSKWMKKLDATK